MSEQSLPRNNSRVRFRGHNRAGTANTGVSIQSPAALAKELFDRRWRWAVLEEEGTNREVGGVCLDENRARTWWGER